MTDYGFKVIYPDAMHLNKAGFGKVGHLPCIFDSGPGYSRYPSRFLVDRGLGLWDPKFRGARRMHPPTRTTMKDFAHWLANALEWAHARGIDLIHADYRDDLIGGYQAEMLSGVWSARQVPLAPTTANVRVQIALEYQMWAADKCLRKQLEIPVVRRTRAASKKSANKEREVRPVEGRKGRAPASEKALSFPSKKAVLTWLEEVHERPIVGKTEGLIVDLILNTAIRREESSCWRVDTLPLDPKDWKISNPDEPDEYQSVLVTIKYGTKGAEFGIDEYGDKIGPEGTIHVPMWLANRIHDYRNNVRLHALKPLLRRARTIEGQRKILTNVVHLFINPNTGKRYTGPQIYKFWASPNHLPGWSPHAGRHWWACCYLEERMRQHTELIQTVLKSPNLAAEHPLFLALKDTATTVIQLEILPQLRHADTATTERYLKWLFSKLRLPLKFNHQSVGLDEPEVVSI